MDLASRFDIRRRLGSGGMGVVYQAHDSDRDEVVAVKVMLKVGGTALYHFKREFRALADIAHPNLVSLYELMQVGDDWLFTMEYVDGVDFLEYVRRPAGAQPNLGKEGHVSQEASSESAPELAARGSFDPDAPTRPHPVGRPVGVPGLQDTVLDEERLRDALAQLVLAVRALHASRKLHRDLKPSNVLVTTEGRVVVCDFGLVQELERKAQTVDGAFGGTIAYMSPEQATGARLTEASDWYSVGVTLFQALTGQLPFVGTEAEVLAAKQGEDAISVGALAPEVPEDLRDLCQELLRIAPHARPDGEAIARRLGLDTVAAAEPALETSELEVPFIGRRREMATLLEAFHASRTGKTVTVFASGPSGVGKSSLLKRFVDGLLEEGQALVLTGRCYERESVPFKAFDGVIDALSSHLARLPRDHVDGLIPPDVRDLSRLFPVLKRVSSIERPPVLSFAAKDPQESRQRAFAGTRELLARLSRSRSIVIAIDDLQWGDLDSGRLLAELTRPPEAPPLLVLVSFRSEERDVSPVLLSLLGEGPAAMTGEVRELAVDALDADHSHRLALRLLGSGDEGHAEAISRESGGNPLFVIELVRYLQAGAHLRDDSADPGDLRLERVLRYRIAQLPEASRQLLAVIALAGQPVELGVAADASGLSDRRQAVAALRKAHLIRTLGTGDRDLVETHHDRVRETTVAALDPERLQHCHRQLAEAYEKRGGVDAEMLVEHWRGAGEDAKAAAHATVAAEKAGEALAFDRAARLYRLALELGDQEVEQERELRIHLGEALGNAGRGPEAAEAYLAAIEGANAAEALELRRRAAQHFLHSGHFDRGLEAIRGVLAAVGMKLASTPTRALLSFLLRRLWAKLRGLSYRTRDPSQLPAELLTRIDILWSVSAGLSLIDTVRGADFQTRHRLICLRAGEPYRIARALALESAFVSTAGGPARRQSESLARRARDLAETVGEPQAIGFVAMVAGVGSFLRGEWREARERCEIAERILRDKCTGVAWELATAQFFGLGSLFFLGDLSELSRAVPARLREAEERGNLYAATGIRSWRTSVAWLAMDDPDEARRQVDKAGEQWSQSGFHLQHYYWLVSLGQIDLYCGDAPSALARLDDRWRDLKRSMLLRVQNVRIEALHLRARSALGTARGGGDERLLTRAKRDARALAREKMRWSTGLSDLVEAGVAAVAGRTEAAVDRLETAEKECRAADMALYVAAARTRRGQLIGGGEGRQLVASTLEEIAAMGAADPRRMVAMLMPGFPELE